MVVLVTGATGFLGRKVVEQLLNHHLAVRCLVHTPGGERVFGQRAVDVYYGSVLDPDALTLACQGVESIVSLVAIIRQTRRATFDQVNRQGVANLVAAAREAGGVKHLVHVSAIGAADNTGYPYLHSKWQGEQEITASGIPHTLFRPSVLFGEGDEFLNALAGMARALPVMPVVGLGRNRFQPIAVEDVARCIALTLNRDDLKGRILEIGGPQQLSYNEIVSHVLRALGKRRMRFHIPVSVMRINVMIMEALLPRPPITSEQLRMLPNRNVGELGLIEQTFGFTPQSLEGNIDFVNSVTFGDGLRMLLGLGAAKPRESPN